MALKQHGYEVSVSRRPRETSLNVVIENFSPRNRDILLEFCRASKKRVAVIMTEHMDFEHRQIFFHGSPLGSRNDYMHPYTMVARTTHLLECLPHIRCFFVLGDLPELRNFTTLLPGLDIRHIPFPSLQEIPFGTLDQPDHVESDVAFTGLMTEFRFEIIDSLKKGKLLVNCPQIFVSRKRRDALNRSAKIILNIPQRERWRWLSLMRIVAGLQVGRATVSVGTNDTSRIASCCTQLDLRKDKWISELQQCVTDWKSLYLRDIENYSHMAKAFEEEHPFPHDVLEYWRITDRVGSCCPQGN
jgi:hypothetical protein